jgi:hypothetical protein
MIKILHFIFISSNLIYHVIIQDFEFQVLMSILLTIPCYFFFIKMMCTLKIYFFGFECFITMLFVFLSPLKAMLCNLDFNLLICVI